MTRTGWRYMAACMRGWCSLCEFNVGGFVSVAWPHFTLPGQKQIHPRQGSLRVSGSLSPSVSLSPLSTCLSFSPCCPGSALSVWWKSHHHVTSTFPGGPRVPELSLSAGWTKLLKIPAGKVREGAGKGGGTGGISISKGKALAPVGN